RTITLQTAPQIRLLQSTDTQLAEKIQSVIVNTIPLWKNQMVISLGIAHSQAAIQAESAVTNATNELLKKNAQTLHMASVEAAKANERGIVDIETLKQTNAELITTLSEVMQVQENGRKARQDAEVELRKMEQELKDKLLEMGRS
ncbi:MAG: toxic anion resistance protein, partial [Lachnospiraceae bacterium]|nr:toxic anion resistance protein [Lachnospiraceae bacterium]